LGFDFWKFSGPGEPGYHRIITRDNSELEFGEFYRLNLPAGSAEKIASGTMEMAFHLIRGNGTIRIGNAGFDCARLDCVYVPCSTEAIVETNDEACSWYIAAAESDLAVEPYHRAYEPGLPVGDRRQVHGEGAAARDVFMTIAPQDTACRLIAGYTWSGDGGWTTWPPHVHEEHLEEIYAYFDMPAPQFGLQLLFNEDMSEFAVHRVREGDIIIAPRGYHPTVAVPGSRNTYLWALAAKNPTTDRRYDLARPHPRFDTGNGPFGQAPD